MTEENESPTISVVSFRVPKDVRRRVKVCAAMDDVSVGDWSSRALDEASRKQLVLERELNPEEEP